MSEPENDWEKVGVCSSNNINTVPDMESRDHEVVVVGCTINLGAGNLEWGGNGRG
jgi:hypothetical protein